MHLTPATLEAAYELLRATPPFKGWRMPEADEVEFVVSRTAALGSAGRTAGGQRYIAISGARHAHLATLLPTMAHEMVHLHDQSTGGRDDVEHGATFRRLAAQVCRHHGFDPKWF